MNPKVILSAALAVSAAALLPPVANANLALTQIEGQRVYWFMVPHVPQQPSLTEGEAENKKVMLKIRYAQKLANHRFICTPLIPKQQKDKDYGSITIAADRPYRLLDGEKHGWASREAGMIVVEPTDKRARGRNGRGFAQHSLISLIPLQPL